MFLDNSGAAIDLSGISQDQQDAIDLINGPIAQSPTITPPTSAPATDPYSIGGILGGISSVITSVSRVIAANKVGTGNVSSSYLRPSGWSTPVSAPSGSGSLLLLGAIGAVAYFMFKKKAA